MDTSLSCLQKHVRKLSSLSSHGFSLDFDVKEVAAAITKGAKASTPQVL